MMRAILSGAAIAAAILVSIAPAKAGLLGYWTFDDDSLNDRSGKGYHAAQPGTPGAPGGTANPVLFSTDLPPIPLREGATTAKSLDCTSNRAAFVSTGGSESVFNFPGNRFTIAYWFKAFPFATGVPFVAKGGELYGGVIQGWQARRNAATNNLDFTTRGIGLNSGDFPSQDAQPGAKASGVWQHAAMVYDGVWKHIYINGVHARSEPAANQSLVATTAKLTFGGRHNPATNVWEGLSNIRLDDVAIFDHALLAAEVGDLYAGADPRRGLRTTSRPFNFGWAATDSVLPTGGPGYLGLREIRVAGQGFPGTANATVYAPTDAVLYARRFPTTPPGVAQIRTKDGTSVPLQTSIDFEDPQLGGLGSNGFAEPFLSNGAAADDSFLQVAQGCFKVNVPGKYTFHFRGDDGMAFAIMGRDWEKLVLNNGAGSISGDAVQAGQPTGDQNTLAVIELPAGRYNWRYVYNEQGGNAWNEALYAPGDKAGYDATFRQFGDPGGGLELVDHVPLADLRASALVVLAGNPANVQLSWGAAYATSVTLNGGAFSNQDVTANTINGLGSISTPSPAATTTYTLTATRGLNSVTREVTVFVDAPPVITSFTADDTTLNAGQAIPFKWTVAGYTTVTISDGTTTTDVTANTDAFGFGSINTLTAPATTTVYTLAVTNAFGSATAQVTIQVGVPPTINSFTASDLFVEADQQVRFDYTVSNADSVTFSPNFSATPTPVPTGQIFERITARSTYTLTAVNGFGVSSQSVTVDVGQPLGVTAAAWTVTLFKANVAINNLAQSQQLIDGTLARGNVVVNGVSTPTPITITNQPRVNYADNAASGAFGGDTWPTANFGAAAIDDFVLRATAVLVVASTGEYTFNINNDDGGRLRIDLNNDGDFIDAGETLIFDDVLSAPHTVTVEKVVNAGTYPIEYIYFERGGGASGEVFYTNDNAQNTLLEFASVAPAITFPDLRITEFLTDNEASIRDSQGDREDWIEIYNGTGAPVSLAGYYLTDESAPTRRNKWAFPTGTPRVLAPGEYFVVFASSKNTTFPGPEYHTNFKLDPEGEYLALTKDDGLDGFVVVHEFAPKYPPQNNDLSYGLYDSEHYTGFFLGLTPGGRNPGGYDGFVIGETQVSATQGGLPTSYDRGFFSAPIMVTLTKDDPSAILRYTLDGSTPSPTNGVTYSGPISINVTTVLRSAAVRQGFITSDVDTHTYIFVNDVITQTAATATTKGWPATTVNTQVFDYGMSPTVVTPNAAAVRSALLAIPTISIVTDIGNLVHPQRGIYVNANGRGRSFERPTSIELLNNDGSGAGQFQIDAGLRIRGGFSRDGNNPKHAWHFYFRNEYDGDLEFPMFGTEGAAQFEQLDLQCPQNYSWSYSPQNLTYAYTAPGNVATTLRLRYNTFVREPVSRDLFGDMGQVYPRTRYYHCYVNGQYWGLYMSQERAEASFGETYLGGNKENYDVIKSAGNAAGYNTEATDGDFIQGTSAAPGSPWAKLWWRTNEMRNTAMTEVQRRTSFFELMGLDPNGVPYNDPVLHPVVLDADNLIDYMLITWYCGSFDAPLSTFLGSASNNWFGLRDRLGMRGFSYIPHDFEHGLGTDLQTTGTWGNGQQNNIRSTDRTGPWGGNGGTNANTNYRGHGMYNQLGTYIKGNPEYFHENLASCLEYRIRFHDRAFRHLSRPGGALTNSNVQATIDARAAVVRSTIIAESARWGDAKGVAAVDFLPAGWEDSITQLKAWVTQGSNAEYIASIPTNVNPAGTPGVGRAARLIAQLRTYQDELVVPTAAGNVALPLYSTLDAPELSSLGGVVASGTMVTITNPNGGGATGTLYYSLDGTDPRLIGGALNPSPSIQTAASPATVALTATGRLMARVFNSTTSTWSGLNFADFIVGIPGTSAHLVITEVNYNPQAGAPGTPTGGDVQSFEFIELQNVSASAVDLTNVRFTNGINYTFPTGRVLAAGERIVVVRDPAAFASRYPDASYPGLSGKTVGPWTGGLDNGSETLTVVDNFDAVITSFTYNDESPWPEGPDGQGATLVFTNNAPLTANKGNGQNWFAHGLTHGNPGGPDITGYAAYATANGASANGTGDLDSDGVVDALEYLLGGSLTTSSSGDLPVADLQVFTVNGVPGEYMTLTYTRAAGTGDLNVVCETATNLDPANWTASAVLVSRAYLNGEETYIYRAPTPSTAQPSQFMRLRVAP